MIAQHNAEDSTDIESSQTDSSSNTSNQRSRENCNCFSAAITGLVGVTVLIVIVVIIVSVVLPAVDSDDTSSLRDEIPEGLRAFNWCGDHKSAALTFSNGPRVEGTPEILRDLKTHGVHGSFFLAPGAGDGVSDEKCSLVREILADGHEIHCHSFSNQDYLSMTIDEIYTDLDQWTSWVTDCAGDLSDKLDSVQFRPPFGNLNAEYAQAISEYGFVVATWNIDSFDYRGGNAETVSANVQTTFETLGDDASAIIMMQDSSYIPAGSEGSLDYIIPFFEELDYSFVTTDQCYEQCSSAVCRLENSWPGTYDVDFSPAANL